MFLILFILDDPDRCQELLEAWEKAGASGITILSSTGIDRIRRKMGLQDDVPLMPSLKDFFRDEENLHRTLITISRERSVVDQIVKSTQAILGDLNQPNTGILVILPVLEAYGLDRYSE